MGRITGSYSAANWATAKANCETLGQKLMTIDSQEEDESFTTASNMSVLGLIRTRRRRQSGFASTK